MTPTPRTATRSTVVRAGLRLAALAVALPLLAACGTTLAPASRDADLREDLREIKLRLVEIQRQGTMTRIQVEELERRIAVLEQRAGIRSPARRSPGASGASGSGGSLTPPSSRPPATTSTPERRGSVPEVRETRQPEPIAPADDDVRGSDIDIDSEPLDPSPGMDDRSMEDPGAAVAAAPISAAAQAIYDRGYTLYHQGRYLDAEAAFQRFLQEYSDTDLADNAQYWIGEARYARGDVPGSLAAFREVVARYPQGNKVPDALLKAGQSLERLGDGESARRSYREVVESFPNSAAAAQAQQRLSALP